MALIGVLVVLALVLLACRLLPAYIKFRRLELAMPGPPTLPLLGSAQFFWNATGDDILERLLAAWGWRPELTRVTLAGQFGVLVSDPEDIEKVCKRRELQNKPWIFYDFLASFSREGLVTINGPQHKAHRKALQPAFHPDVLERYMDVFVEESNRFVDSRIVPNSLQDIGHILREATARSFFRTALVSEVDESTEKILPDLMHFLEMVPRTINHRTFTPWLWFDWVFNLTPSARANRKLKERIDAFTSKVIATRRAQICRRNSAADFIRARHTLIDVLVRADSLTESEIIDEFTIFLGAAVETTVAALGWTFKVLSLRPDVQDRLRAEVDEAFQGKGVVTNQDLEKLAYTECVLKETLRLLPAIPVTARGNREEIELGGYTIPAGSTLILNIIGAHRDPRHWPDPELFDPDRFTPERSAGRHPFAYLPFSAGSRNCIGGRYSMMLMKTLLATTMQRYRVDPAPDGHTNPAHFPMTFDVASRMPGGVHVIFTERTTCSAGEKNFRR